MPDAGETAEKATGLAESYGNALVQISEAINSERSQAWKIQRVRLIIAGLGPTTDWGYDPVPSRDS